MLDILRSTDAAKREKVSAAVDKFNFGSPTSSIEQLIKVCHEVIGADLENGDIPDLKQMLTEGK